MNITSSPHIIFKQRLIKEWLNGQLLKPLGTSSMRHSLNEETLLKILLKASDASTPTLKNRTVCEIQREPEY
jgi:hypothetical protein